MTNNVFTQSEESLWKRMPSGLKSLLLTSNEEIKLDKLLTFYNTSNFRDISTNKYTPKYSFVLANYYVHQINNVQAACNLIFNANFILYLNKSTTHTTIGAAIDYFLDRAQFVHATHLSSAVQTFNHTNWKEIDSEDTLYELTALNEFPTLYTAYQITAKCSNSRKDEQRLNKLREYTTKAIVNDYNQLVTKRNEVVDHLMGSGDWWKSDTNNDHHRGKKKKSSGSSGPEKSAPPQDKEEIVIKFVDEQSQEEEEEVSIKITKSTQLKIPFNQYAEGRRLSLRSFRFVYGGNTLFVSSVGKQTPIDLGMEDGDVITVINLEAGKEEGVDVEKKPVVAKAAVKQKKSSSKKRTKGKQKKKRASQPLVIQQTEVELKVEHSKLLGKVHEEAESQFKLIRQRLNNLVLERSKPKSKKKHKAPLQSISQVVNTTPSSLGLGGKAGKTHYTIQVGEVSNLYKTSKRRRSRSPLTNQQKTLKIDLHGLTRQESLKSLDDSLPIWQERAMSGSYPFVVPVEIVCGGGSQVLSEVVEQWIRNNDQVANAPKTR